MAVNVSVGGPGPDHGYLAPGTSLGVLRYAMPRSDDETFGEMVERLRNRLPRHIRAREKFAELAGISASTLEKIETGATKDPDTETVRRIAKGLAKGSGKPVPVASISYLLDWIPLDEVGADWFFTGLTDDDRDILSRMADRLRATRAEEHPPAEAVVHRPRRSARS